MFGASSEQNGMFTLEKHEWPIEPFLPGADMISTVEFAGSETIDAFCAFQLVVCMHFQVTIFMVMPDFRIPNLDNGDI